MSARSEWCSDCASLVAAVIVPTPFPDARDRTCPECGSDTLAPPFEGYPRGFRRAVKAHRWGRARELETRHAARWCDRLTRNGMVMS